jgi:stearoyl-CoA desaturase (delta-9 desaturase)
MFLITGVRHRYFSHRTYKTSRWFQFLLAFFSTGDMQKGNIWWAYHHRIHHTHSDQPDDPHTTLYRATKWQGIWWAHAGWILCGKFNNTDYDKIRDLAKFPELVFLNKPYGYLIMPVLSAMGLAYLGLCLDGGSGAVWMLVLGFFASTTLLYHGTFSINSVAHLVGTQAFDTGDQSRNNWWLAIITLGEGWHNNHHADEYCERQGREWWQIDISHYIIVILSWLRLVWNIRGPRLPKVASV